MWELLCRKEPFEGSGGVQVAYLAVQQGLRPEVARYCPPLFAQLNARVLGGGPLPLPYMRPDFGAILERLFAMMKEVARGRGGKGHGEGRGGADMTTRLEAQGRASMRTPTPTRTRRPTQR
jgi:hypothetical protein